jgi:hypothetical protein
VTPEPVVEVRAFISAGASAREGSTTSTRSCSSTTSSRLSRETTEARLVRKEGTPMSYRTARLVALVALVFATSAGAQQPAAAAEAIEIAHTFLMAWGHERWDELKTVAGDRVTIRARDKTYTLQPGSVSEVKLVFPFSGLSTVRVDGAVKGVAIAVLVLKVGDNEVRGTGTLTFQEKDGGFRVVGVSIGK